VKTCVVVPTYNEAAGIGEVVTLARASAPTADLLIVDDNSPDGTGRIADALAGQDAAIHVLHRSRKGGLGPAYIAGFRWALARDYAAIVEMDADLSHDPADLPRLITATAEADLVLGSRYVPGGDTRNWSPNRVRLSRAGNAYARALLRLPVADATSGFRCFRREVLEAVPLDEIRSHGYAFQIEMAWRTWLLGFQIMEVPIVFVERRVGASKMSRRIVGEAVGSVARWGVKCRRPPSAPHPRSVVSSKA